MQDNRGSPPSLSRREFLSSSGALTLCGTLGLSAAVQAADPSAPPAAPAAGQPYSPQPRNVNPRWYGFNLLDYLTSDPGWRKSYPYESTGEFAERDFRWIRDWGFNFVRVPTDYRFWTDPNDLFKIDEAHIAPIDRAVWLAQKYGLHMNFCLHRAPGFCAFDLAPNPPTTVREPSSFYDDVRLRDAFVFQWDFFAGRYRGIPSNDLSFNLVNEPARLPKDFDYTRLALMSAAETVAYIGRDASDYVSIAKAAIDTIRGRDPQRLIVADGFPAGGIPIDAFREIPYVVQSHHSYSWANKDQPIDRFIESEFSPWREAAKHGVPMHMGECAFSGGSHATAMQWYTKLLDATSEINMGFALGHFRGPMGVLDSRRNDVRYENWYGRQLDRELLDLLRRNIRG